MLTGQFLINGIPPFNEPLPRELLVARAYLSSGQVELACNVLVPYINNINNPELLRCFSHLVRSFAWRLAYLTRDRTTVTLAVLSEADYRAAFKLNKKLTQEEVEGYSLVCLWLLRWREINKQDSKKLSFDEVHYQAWQTYFTEIQLENENKKIPANGKKTLLMASEGLAKWGSNYYLWYLRSVGQVLEAIKLPSEKMILQAVKVAEEYVNNAIKFGQQDCAKHSRPRMHFHLANIRLLQGNVVDAFSEFCKGIVDDEYGNETENAGRLFIFNKLVDCYPTEQFLSIMASRNLEVSKKIGELTALIAISKTKSELYVQRGDLLARMKMWKQALAEYSIACWQIKTRLDLNASIPAEKIYSKITHAAKMFEKEQQDAENAACSAAQSSLFAELSAEKRNKKQANNQKHQQALERKEQKRLQGLVLEKQELPQAVEVELEQKKQLSDESKKKKHDQRKKQKTIRRQLRSSAEQKTESAVNVALVPDGEDATAVNAPTPVNDLVVSSKADVSPKFPKYVCTLPIANIALPDNVQTLLDYLAQAGATRSYLVGGFIRDQLRVNAGLPVLGGPHDIDIVTNATDAMVEKLYPGVKKEFGIYKIADLNGEIYQSEYLSDDTLLDHQA